MFDAILSSMDVFWLISHNADHHQRIRGFTTMRYINQLLLTYLLTYINK